MCAIFHFDLYHKKLFFVTVLYYGLIIDLDKRFDRHKLVKIRLMNKLVCATFGNKQTDTYQ